MDTSEDLKVRFESSLLMPRESFCLATKNSVLCGIKYHDELQTRGELEEGFERFSIQLRNYDFNNTKNVRGTYHVPKANMGKPGSDLNLSSADILDIRLPDAKGPYDSVNCSCCKVCLVEKCTLTNFHCFLFEEDLRQDAIRGRKLQNPCSVARETLRCENRVVGIETKLQLRASMHRAKGHT